MNAPMPNPSPEAAASAPALKAVPDPAPADPHDFSAELEAIPHDPRDPDPYLALYLDRGLPLDEQVRAALTLDLRSFSRRVLHRIFKPFSRIAIGVLGFLKVFVPNAFTSSKILHKLIRWGLEIFVSPQANFLILRHFHVGSEISAFIAANAPVPVETSPLRPRVLKDVEGEIFLKHDLNLYNFLIRLNTALRKSGAQMRPPERLNFDMITDGPFDIAPLPKRWTNFIDVSSAIEVYTPMYQAWLTDNDFRRAYLSLQLDETIAIHAATLLGDPTHLAMVNNRHPLVPLSAFRAGHRLVLHGLASECLHQLLVRHKRLQKKMDAEGVKAAPGAHGFGALMGIKPGQGGAGNGGGGGR